MKKIPLLLKICTAIGFLIACDEDADLFDAIDQTSGALPNIEKLTTADAFINFEKTEVSEDVTLAFSTEVAFGNAVSFDVVGIYKKAEENIDPNDETASTTFKTTFFKDQPVSLTEFSLTSQDLIDQFDGLNSLEDFEVGDILTISVEIINSEDQRILILQEDGSNNFSQNIPSSVQGEGESFSLSVDYPVSCPSNIGGTYTVFSNNGVSANLGPDDDNTLDDYTFEVTLMDTGGGIYTPSDVFFGVYTLWYGASPATNNITDICGALGAEFTGPFNGDIVVTGTVNDDNTISIGWTNSFGDFANFILTPK